jgi:D-lactate dehydrogenase
MKIGVFEIEEWEKKVFEDAFGTENVSFFAENLTEENCSAVQDVEVVSVFIYSQLTKELLEKLPRLRCIITRSTGYDHIDIAYCKEKGITVSNVPAYGTHSVAEHTFALLLAISRMLIPSIERTQKGNFDLTGLMGFDLFGKTLGLIGFGNIGKHVSQIAKGFGMKCIVFTDNPHLEDAPTYGIEFLSFSELLGRADIVSLHVPLTPETTHIIRAETIAQMKSGSVLLNTARGGLIDTAGLVDALTSGKIKAAGIDVIEEECSIKEERQLLTKRFLQECDLQTQLLNHVLLTKENVLITPHNAFNSQESLHTILSVTIEDIQAFISGKPINTV